MEDTGCRSKFTCSEGLPSRPDSLHEYLQSPVAKVTLRDTASVRYIRPVRNRKALVQAIFLEAFFLSPYLCNICTAGIKTAAFAMDPNKIFRNQAVQG